MIIVVGDDADPRRRQPVMVLALLLACIGTWIWQLFDPAFGMAWSAVPAEFWQLERVPREIHATDAWGRRITLLTAPPATWMILLTPFTSMFLHGSWAHLLGNMMFLWTFGAQIEDRLGRLRFLGFYLLCGLLACAGHVAAVGADPTPLVGASGAISGLLGAYLLISPWRRIHLLVFFIFLWRVPAFLLLIGWLYLQWGGLRSGVGNVAYLAHLAGFAAGMLLVRPLTPADT